MCLCYPGSNWYNDSRTQTLSVKLEKHVFENVCVKFSKWLFHRIIHLGLKISTVLRLRQFNLISHPIPMLFTTH